MEKRLKVNEKHFDSFQSKVQNIFNILSQKIDSFNNSPEHVYLGGQQEEDTQHGVIETEQNQQRSATVDIVQQSPEITEISNDTCQQKGVDNHASKSAVSEVPDLNPPPTLSACSDMPHRTSAFPLNGGFY